MNDSEGLSGVIAYYTISAKGTVKTKTSKLSVVPKAKKVNKNCIKGGEFMASGIGIPGVILGVALVVGIGAFVWGAIRNWAHFFKERKAGEK